MAVWGFAPVGRKSRVALCNSFFSSRRLLLSTTVATNTARDLGARLMTLTIWGMKAGGGAYAAIAALTNIVGTLVAITFYEFILTDSARGTSPIPAAMGAYVRMCF